LIKRVLHVLHRWLMGRDESRKAKPRLHAYPAYTAPFPTKVETLEQAQANLDYLLANREQRLRVVTEFLGGAGVDVASGAAAENVEPLMLELHRWSRREFPALFDPRIARREIWWASNRGGAEIVYSLLMDVALLCGELVIARRPEYSWSLNLDPEDGKLKAPTYRRVVVQRPPGGPFPAAIIFDFETTVVGQYMETRSPLFPIAASSAINEQVVMAIRGDYEAYWLERQRNGLPPLRTDPPPPE
jgi:hypothetical protein